MTIEEISRDKEAKAELKKYADNFHSCLVAIDWFRNVQDILDTAWKQIQEVKKILVLVGK